MPLVRNNIRTACRVVATWGSAVGGVIATLQLGPRAGHEDELRSWLSTTALPGAAEYPGIVASHLLEGDAGVSTAARSDEKKLLATPDALVRSVLLVEAIHAAAAEAPGRDLLTPQTIARPGGAHAPRLRLYRL